MVVNLSNYELTEHEIALLSKGLKFIPTPTRTNKTELLADIKKFGRRMRLKEFFLDQNDDQFNYTKVDLRKPSKFTPKPGREPALDFYLKSLERVILNSEARKCKFNVSKEERDAIIGLRKNKNIVIFEADKGGAVVIMNKQDYVTEALKHLDSKDANGDDIYQKLPFDCTQKFVREVQQAVDLAFSNNVIDESMAEMLVINDANQETYTSYPRYIKT